MVAIISELRKGGGLGFLVSFQAGEHGRRVHQSAISPMPRKHTSSMSSKVFATWKGKEVT